MKPPPVPISAGLVCEKCNGSMAQTRVRRLSGVLVAIGYTLVIPSLLVLLAVTLFFFLGAASTPSAMGSMDSVATSNAVVQLHSIDGVSAEFIALFQTNHWLATKKADDLQEPAKSKVLDVVRSFQGHKLATGAATGVIAVVGIGVLVATYFFLIPVLIIGFLLTLKKRVWRCRNCGFIFDRA